MKKDDIWLLALENAPFAKKETPLDFLKNQDSDIIFSLLKKEIPSVIATVIFCIGKEKGKEVLSRFDSAHKKEILKIMYLDNSVSDTVLKVISDTLRLKI